MGHQAGPGSFLEAPSALFPSEAKASGSPWLQGRDNCLCFQSDVERPCVSSGSWPSSSKMHGGNPLGGAQPAGSPLSVKASPASSRLPQGPGGSRVSHTPKPGLAPLSSSVAPPSPPLPRLSACPLLPQLALSSAE